MTKNIHDERSIKRVLTFLDTVAKKINTGKVFSISKLAIKMKLDYASIFVKVLRESGILTISGNSKRPTYRLSSTTFTEEDARTLLEFCRTSVDEYNKKRREREKQRLTNPPVATSEVEDTPEPEPTRDVIEKTAFDDQLLEAVSVFDKYPDADLFAELKRRGYSGTLEIVKKTQVIV